MNYAWIVDAVLLFIFLHTLYQSYRRGFVRSIAGVITVLGAAFCAMTGRFVLDGVLERHIFGPLIEGTVHGVLDHALENLEAQTVTAAEAIKNAAESLIAQAESIGFSYQTDFVDALHMDTDALAKTIAAPIAERLSEIAAFLLIFAIASFILKLVFNLLSAIVRMPVLNSANKFLGLCCGAVLGVAYTWIAAQLIALVIGILYANGTLPAEAAAMMDSTIFKFFTHGGIAGNAGTAI